MKHLHTFESFIGNINEGVGGQIALKYDASPLADFDTDNMYISDEGGKTLNKLLRTYKDDDFINNKEYVESNGESWEDHLKELKDKNVKHDVIDDDEDSIVLFKK